ncbi:hypothetical protein H4P12_02735 [Paracoccus sp. 11-3]|uniref:Polyketide cyclase / dehydrase and lipid transport n=1 Tax=Paracoccus amoyensis TaxID=2760093 RepID=A0A926JA45_9RHOB|nr:hypothetical protein [Paracoccus amoyensis]MBC9245651.1 hypothetical protein [Paracoccus amoyensis]
MKFSTRLDVEEPATVLFDQIGNAEQLEKLLVQRGASVTRMDPARESGTALGWVIGFNWRGRRRNLRLKVTRFDRPELILMSGQGDSFDVEIGMSVVALSKSRSRLNFETDVRPRNMRARLLLQTAKLAKPQLDTKFARRVGELLHQLRTV